MLVIVICALAVPSLLASPARAWGAKGHHIVNGVAAQTLPAQIPAFMRSRQAVAELTYLGLELDLLKGAGAEWDADLDPGHYVDLRDDGTVVGAVKLSALPPTREAYDTLLRVHGSTQYAAGFLPYSILQGWEQLRMMFAYWRVDDYEARHAPAARLRAIAASRRAIDERVVLSTAGIWGHYVADASQPLHVTVHFNGWGKYPNPNGYSQSEHFHDLFETDAVDRFITSADVVKRLPALTVTPSSHLAGDAQVLTAVEHYLARSNATVVQLYRIGKSNGFRTGTPQARAFLAERLAFGAGELRSLIVWAWFDSLNETIGDDAPQRVRDILNGAPYKGF